MTTLANNEYPLNTIYFYLTKGCNLKCRHCWISPEYQTRDQVGAYLSVDLFESIVQQAKPLGLSGVKLTGGEPLLHPQIHELLDIVQREDLRLSMETNGVLCGREEAERIAACKKTFVSVSLDGADEEIHEWVRGVKGCFEEAITGIRNLTNAGIKPQIIMSIMEKNKNQMADVVKLAETLGARSVKFNIVSPTSRGEKMHAEGDVLSIEELVALGEWVENELSSSTDLHIFYGHPPAFRALGKLFGSNGGGCGVCHIKHILGVLSDGSYSLCGIGENVPDLIFGHASTDSLEDVWKNTSILRDIRNDVPDKLEGICKTCLLSKQCLGSCIAQNYYSSNSLCSPFWYCEQAHQKGLFPVGRLQDLCCESVNN